MQFAQDNAQTKNCIRACFANADKIVFKKFPNASKKKNTPTHDQTMTQKLNINRTYSDTVDRRPAGNSTYKKLAVQWLNQVHFLYQTFLQADSFVLLNRQLLSAANR